MMRLSLTKLVAAVGGAAFALAASSGIASADPLDPVVNTTCNFGQVMAALNATDPAAAGQFNASPIAQAYLRNFLASPPGKRLQMAQQIQAMPQAAPYFNDVLAVAGTCNQY
jgi:hemophore-related protein